LPVPLDSSPWFFVDPQPPPPPPPPNNSGDCRRTIADLGKGGAGLLLKGRGPTIGPTKKSPRNLPTTAQTTSRDLCATPPTTITTTTTPNSPSSTCLRYSDLKTQKNTFTYFPSPPHPPRFRKQAFFKNSPCNIEPKQQLRTTVSKVSEANQRGLTSPIAITRSHNER
jgi:hypothetical protein